MVQTGPDMAAALRLDGRVALITAAANGIGRATAEVLAGLGAMVVVTDLEGEGAAAVADGLQQAGHRAEHRRMDVREEGETAAVIADAAARHGRLDILVAAAGSGARVPSETLATERWQGVIDTNLTGSFRPAREAAKAMIGHGGGAMVFVASIMGLVGGGLYPNAAYQASKGGLVSLTRALALDWAPHGIRVNAVAPAFARTRLTENLLADPAMEKAILEATPMGRLLEPVEVAWAIAFLVSDAAAMITGVTLPVDGGWTAR
jgi:NAD(P)-dependent dehydrogenase (short-subunit alcohol dehydrogenase family)